MEDKEFFRLCKEVYKRSDYDWTDVPQYFTETGLSIVDDTSLNAITPVYTSDYILKKLPPSINEIGLTLYEGVYFMPGKWSAGYSNGFEGGTASDSPEKALLKLTIALYEAGELSVHN